MDDKAKEFMCEYNASVKHGDPVTKVSFLTGIAVKIKVCCTQSKMRKLTIPKSWINPLEKRERESLLVLEKQTTLSVIIDE